ncbi:cupin domain-containing protein [Staphylococcus cohnii]|uniref:cupin domain-containing protein n=1 Tax=Staphylococcus cohnii TaxID=29382 RepID=UPI003D7C6AAE
MDTLTPNPNIQIETISCDSDDSIPNNSRYALLLYKNVIKPKESPLDILSKNNWSNAWRGGIFPTHHYHSNTHEVLIVVSGKATVQLGGELGPHVDIQQGDVIIIPAGFGHKLVHSHHDFAVIGAYPNGNDCDFCTGKPDEWPQNLENIKNISLPDTDPIYGKDGPLYKYWQ